ncbi:MAG: hypothetical protein JNK00_09710 [Flavipsychrobacter sp.]|nr:hypothetical protein [Flavipsychrobacter sp.]
MKFNITKVITITTAAIMLQSAFTACKKDNDNTTTPSPSTPTPAVYPKTVSIEFSLVSESGIDTASTILYTNETGGNNTVNNVKLPFSKKLTRTVKKYDNLGFGFNTYGVGSFRMKMVVDGVIVKEQTYNGTTAISGTLAYIFQ